jgi:secreted protein with Ig-like and vWFA domain
MKENQQTISPDDPKLTAYALGELSGDDRVAFEILVEHDLAAQAAITEIRALAAQLAGVLAEEAKDDPASLKSDAINKGEVGALERAPEDAKRDEAKRDEDPYRKKIVRFPYVWIGSLAAACFAVLLAVRENPPVRVLETGQQPSVDAEQASNEKLLADQLAKKPARTFSVGTPPARVAKAAPPTILLVKDADEFAALPAPTPGVGKPEESTATAGTGAPLASVAHAFVAASEPIKVDLSFKSHSSNALGLAAAEGNSGRSDRAVNFGLDVDSAKSWGGPGGGPAPATASTPGKPTALAATGRSEAENTDGLVLESFVVSSEKFRKAVPLSVAESRNNGREVISADAFGAVRSGRAQSFYYMGGVDRLSTDLRTKSGAPVFNAETYAFQPENDFFRVRSSPLSTFSIDVDTASYANVRRFLDQGRRPPRDAVRVEEMVNYFNYRYAPPSKSENEPFAASMEIAAAPWNPAHRLVRIGLKGRELSVENRPAANLVFLLDVSGSMNAENKLPLVKESLRMLVEKLRTDDRVAIVTYAGASGLALPSTPAGKKRAILDALDELHPEGSTNGALGIQLAYDIAKANFIAGGANRVILCTDGDFNVGMTGDGDLTRLIEEKAKSGVFLTVLGFGMGNYKDGTLERLADKGNGNYGYVDSRAEAQKLLVEQAGGTLVTIAKDVKLQVEFNPAVARSYRLIGYENRALKKEDFNNDKVDAGEIGAGHTVTALYEIVPVGAPVADSSPEVDALKYQPVAAPDSEAGSEGELAQDDFSRNGGASSRELLTLKIRFKEPTVDVSRKIEIPAIDTGEAFETASKDFKFAAAVASLGMILRESVYKGTSDYDHVISWAEAGKGDDVDGRRGEFIELVKKARTLSAE